MTDTEQAKLLKNFLKPFWCQLSAYQLCFPANTTTCRQSPCSLKLCAVCHVSVAMVTGEVPARAGEAEGGVGESSEGGGRRGEEVP